MKPIENENEKVRASSDLRSKKSLSMAGLIVLVKAGAGLPTSFSPFLVLFSCHGELLRKIHEEDSFEG